MGMWRAMDRAEAESQRFLKYYLASHTDGRLPRVALESGVKPKEARGKGRGSQIK